MVWFPGKWFGYIVEGYPTIKPGSMEFVVRIFIPLISCALLIIYSLRDKGKELRSDSPVKTSGPSTSNILKVTFILSIGLFLGLLVGYLLLKPHPQLKNSANKRLERFQAHNNEFREFCKREGYREEVEDLTDWLKGKQAKEIAILYNVDDTYSSDIYKVFSQRINDENIKIVFSDRFKPGEVSFYSRLKIIESLKPEAIIFLGRYNERIAFLDDISHRSQLPFWKSRLDKIVWIE